MEAKKEEIGDLKEKYTKRIEEELGIKSSAARTIKEEKRLVSREYREFREEFMPPHLSLYEKLCNLSEKILKIKPDPNKEKIIAEAYLTLTKHIQTVVKKKEVHSGVFRTRRVQIIAGKRTKETIHYENGIKLKVHLEKTYFTSRLANERLRIAKLVQKDEEVLVMFSGVAPYPLVIAKNSEAKKVYGIEINPFAHQYALENIALNKLEDKVVIYEGDVRNLLPKLRKKFDRIVMPLPKTGEEFLYLVLPRLKHNGFIHLYAFLEEGKIEAERKQILERGRVLGYSLECRTIVTCGQFSPSTFRVCFDLKMREKRKKKI